MIFEGFDCWKKFFNYVNLHEHRIKAELLLVDKTDLVGLEELWQLCLNVQDADIAQQAISFLLNNIYINLAPKHKKVGVIDHFNYLFTGVFFLVNQ